MTKKIYFASDFHLGIPDHDRSLEREKKLIDWLDQACVDATEIFLLGDLFDFWFEYKTVIPRGYARLMGKLADITDSGIRVHLFLGNHDMWAFDYLHRELNIQLHRGPEFREFYGKKFYLAHGDGLGPGDHGYKFIKKIFANRCNQWLFRLIHPDCGISMALFWSRKSRAAAIDKEQREEARNRRLIDERITIHSRELLTTHPDLDFLVYGHYHYPILMPLSDKATQIVLGDWLTHFTFAVFDGQKLELKRFF
ncbi:MAG: UDP-2,3-diacylglucosamine diphosphatase [Bacteroidales bacterium]|nr:UDP-2,3-diacylglucosamine diphosphatase [Bacteroidales bacterium]